MDYQQDIRRVLDYVDAHITHDLSIEALALYASYSPTHLVRVFQSAIGMPPMTYVARRKLQHALRDLLGGRRIIDVAMEYGFETHAGFTRSFKRHYGYPPSLARLHLGTALPNRYDILNHDRGGFALHPEICDMPPMAIVGYASRHRMPDVCGISDIPAYWDSIGLDFGAMLSTLHHTYSKSQHREVCVCLDIDEVNGCFTYMLAVGVDDADEGVPQRPGTFRTKLTGGLYAAFRTPFVQEDVYVASIHEAWKQILGEWLPGSAYRYDDARMAFEYYDESDHVELHDGKASMMIYIPVVAK